MMVRGRSELHWGVGTAVLAAAAALLVTLIVMLAAAPAGAHPGKGRGGPQRSYLALGDSLAFGFQQAKFNALFPNENPAAFDTGYVDDLAAAIEQRYPRLQVVNDGCPAETTDSLISGPCQYQLAFPLHHPYAGGPASSQLSDALAFLSAHRNFVNPITIDIGANDVLAVAEHVCALQLSCVGEHTPALIAHITANLGLILADLRQAAPHAKIAVLGLYNPFGPALPGSDQLSALINEAMASVAQSVGALFVDPLPVFNPIGPSEEETVCQLTNMCPQGTIDLVHGDIHASDRGYAVLAGLTLEQLRSTPPFGPPFFGRH
jgi:lysophospholipase L1-like esterase